MKSLHLLHIFLLYTGSTRITQKKLCINCKHFIANKRKCAIFGEPDLVTGKNDYTYASLARREINKCGEKATYYEENKMKLVTASYYFVSDYWPMALFVWLYCNFLWFVYRISQL